VESFFSIAWAAGGNCEERITAGRHATRGERLQADRVWRPVSASGEAPPVFLQALCAGFFARSAGAVDEGATRARYAKAHSCASGARWHVSEELNGNYCFETAFFVGSGWRSISHSFAALSPAAISCGCIMLFKKRICPTPALSPFAAAMDDHL